VHAGDYGMSVPEELRPKMKESSAMAKALRVLDAPPPPPPPPPPPAASRFRSPASSFSSPFRLCAEASKLSALHPTLGCSRVRLLP